MPRPYRHAGDAAKRDRRPPANAILVEFQLNRRRNDGEVTVTFGTTVAVDGLSLEIESGTTFGLLGPNGAGKSTTNHMLVGAIKPDSGTIVINGASDPTRAEVRRDIGIAPQRLALYDELTGGENLAFSAENMRTLSGNINTTAEMTYPAGNGRTKTVSANTHS